LLRDCHLSACRYLVARLQQRDPLVVTISREKKQLVYHFRAHPKLDPHHFFGRKNAEFQPNIVCKPSNIDVALIKGRRGSVCLFTDNNNEYQLLDF
jgi:hypothetical protein